MYVRKYFLVPIYKEQQEFKNQTVLCWFFPGLGVGLNVVIVHCVRVVGPGYTFPLLPHTGNSSTRTPFLTSPYSLP